MSRTFPKQPAVMKVRSECWWNKEQGDLYEIPENLRSLNHSRTVGELCMPRGILSALQVRGKSFTANGSMMKVLQGERDQLDHGEWLTTGGGHKSLPIYSRVNVVKDLQGLSRHRKRADVGNFESVQKLTAMCWQEMSKPGRSSAARKRKEWHLWKPQPGRSVEVFMSQIVTSLNNL